VVGAPHVERALAFFLLDSVLVAGLRGGEVTRDIIDNESSVACRLRRPPVTLPRRLGISQGAPIVKASGNDTKSFQRFDDCDAGNG